jgi:hypothetical protein
MKRLHRPYYDPNTISPLKAACKDDGERYPIERIERMKGNSQKKESLKFLVYWIDYQEPTWGPWSNVRNTVALYNFLKENNLDRLIPKNIKYADSDEEWESEGEEEEGRN